MSQSKVWATALLLSGVLLGGASCGVTEYLNCDDLCNKKKECGTDSNYDVSNCINVCSGDANQSSDYARQVDTCKACEAGVSCDDFVKQAGCLVNCPSLP
jgi:hypothetical protein